MEPQCDCNRQSIAYFKSYMTSLHSDCDINCSVHNSPGSCPAGHDIDPSTSLLWILSFARVRFGRRRKKKDRHRLVLRNRIRPCNIQRVVQQRQAWLEVAAVAHASVPTARQLLHQVNRVAERPKPLPSCSYTIPTCCRTACWQAEAEELPCFLREMCLHCCRRTER